MGQYAHSSLRPVANYVPRPRVHQKIKEQLRNSTNDGAQEMRILAVCGLGGAGKSQLVLNYIREYRQDYSAVFWIEAGSKESIERDYVQIYRLLYGRPVGTGQEILKVEDAVAGVKSWFHGREGQWLVVLDSADTIDNDQDRSYIDLGYSSLRRRGCILSSHRAALRSRRCRSWRRSRSRTWSQQKRRNCFRDVQK